MIVDTSERRQTGRHRALPCRSSRRRPPRPVSLERQHCKSTKVCSRSDSCVSMTGVLRGRAAVDCEPAEQGAALRVAKRLIDQRTGDVSIRLRGYATVRSFEGNGPKAVHQHRFQCVPDGDRLTRKTLETEMRRREFIAALGSAAALPTVGRASRPSACVSSAC